MIRSLPALAVFGVVLLACQPSRAETAVLVVASDASQLAELELAKVMARDASLWLSVRLSGQTQLAVVTSEARVEQDPAADAWLRSLDFATRMRVAPPRGPVADCAGGTTSRLADSGLPEARALVAREVTRSGTPLELARTLIDAGLNAEVTSLAQFSAAAEAPFRVVLYDVPSNGGSTPALRITEQGHPNDLPPLFVSGRSFTPLTLIALAHGGVLPLSTEASDPSEFAVSYRLGSAWTDYATERVRWSNENSARWMIEAQATPALFAWTAFPGEGAIAPVVPRYFQAVSTGSARACEARAAMAGLHGSQAASDFECAGAPDLARSMTELGFAEARLSRLIGSVSKAGDHFRVSALPTKNPRLEATDVDRKDCDPVLVAVPGASGDGSSPPAPTAAVGAPPETAEPGSPVYQSDGSCNGAVLGSGSSDSCTGSSTGTDATGSDSCSGDSSSSDPSADSCSGSSTSSEPATDSCSGSSSTSDSGSDSCSGSSDTSDGSSGCGKSEYDGDTCSGSSSTGASEGKASQSSALLLPGDRGAGRRRRPLRLSFLTLLAAALALPLRRRAGSR